MARPGLLLFSLVLLNNCFLLRDDSQLSSGAKKPHSAVDAGSAVLVLNDGAVDSAPEPVEPPVEPPLADAGTATNGCDDFGSYAVGSLPPNWRPQGGKWKVVHSGSTSELGSAVDGGGGPAIITTGSAQADVRVSATVISTQYTGDDCLLARAREPNDAYILCIGKRGGTTKWKLSRVINNQETSLASENYDLSGSATHALELTARGTRLSGLVDGKDVVSVSDDSIARGAVGLASDRGGAFTAFCATP
jgi:hypothetical protein